MDVSEFLGNLKESMKERVVFINLWPKGGMCHYSDALVNILTKRMDVLYCTNYSNSFVTESRIIHFTTSVFDLQNYISIIRLIRCIHQFQPDFVHLNSGHPLLLLMYPYFYFHHSVVTVHDAIPHEGERYLKKLFHAVQLYCFAIFFKKIIVHSELIKNQLPKYLNQNKVFVVPHVNYQYLAEQYPETKKKVSQKFTVLFFGRILKYKGLSFLVEAFQFLDENMYELIIAGEGKIGLEINKCNIQILNRFISDEEMVDLFRLADVVVVPYVSASQSGVVYLSFACVKPVIATNVGSLSEVVHNQENGILVDPRSSKDIAKAIEVLNDPTVYQRLVRNIQVQNLSSDQQVFEALSAAYAYPDSI